MNLNETVLTEIKAHPDWNRTEIVITSGEHYLMTATGRWIDFYIPHGPDGDPSPNAYLRSFESKRRVPEADWFTLIGAIDSQLATAFRIGSFCNYAASITGELTCFANDVDGFYWNNWGHVTLSVTRLA